MTQITAPAWQDVDVDGAVVRVMSHGDPDADPLLFLHGWGLTPRCYAGGITQLTRAGVRVLAPCLPGFGGSDGPPLRGIDLPAYATRIGRLLEVLGVERPVFVAGHSFGGGVALQLASQRPGLVRSLTLVSSVGGAPGGSGLSDGSWLRWAVAATTELAPTSAAQALHLARSMPSVLRAFVPNALRKPVTLALTARLALTASLAAQAEALVDAGVPVLFVWGDGDRLIAPGALGDVVAQLPAEVVHGRHGWLMTEPDEFATLLRNALVVHAMLERRKRGQAMVLPAGTSLVDFIPLERRTVARHAAALAARTGTIPG